MIRPSLRFLLPAMALVMVLPLGAKDSLETFKIDQVHSAVGFKIKHFLSKVPGQFNSFKGTIKLDESDLAKSSVEATIDAGSIYTANEFRDKHLVGPEFFDTAKYPTITFKSTGIKVTGTAQMDITGEFTMHGVTKAVTIKAAFNGTAPGMKAGSKLAGFEGALTLKRADFGVNGPKGLSGLLGDDVEITINIEAGLVPNP